MKAIVTGGAGFIGSHLVRELLAGQHQVHVMDDLSTGRAELVDPRAALHVQDIRSKEAASIIADIRPDVVFHLAAQADVQRSIQEPYTDADINIAGTARILAACRDYGVKKLVFASTSAVYGDLQKEKLEESDPAFPISFYGLSKWTGEQYIQLFSRMYGLPFTILRYGNVYGPGQTAKGEGGVIALFMERLAKGEPLHIHGDGEQTRDFIYVGDIVKANLAAAAAGAGDGCVLHAATGWSTSVNSIARLLQELHPKDVELRYGSARAGDIKHSCLSPEHTAGTLGWRAGQNIRAGLKATYRHWFPD